VASYERRNIECSFRLISLVCFVLLVSLALGGLIAYSNASRSMRIEMRGRP